MIRLEKDENIPATLTSEQVVTELKKLDRLAESGAIITHGDFKAGLYGAEDVRTALKKDQYGKCAYCESLLEVSSAAQIEHFRPKTYSQQGKGGAIHRPGYYWLAYDWNNLLAACSVCNQQYKKNYFPLEDDSQRADRHTRTLSHENPLLINPYMDNPDIHIIFHREIAVGLTPKGETSIEYYGLNRKALLKERQEKYETFRILEDIRKLLEARRENNPGIYKSIVEKLERMTDHEACYSGMFCHQEDGLF